MSYIRRIELLPQPTSITCDDGRKNADVYCLAKPCPIPDGLMPTNGNSSGTCEWYMNDYGLCGSDGCSCEPTCLPGYILSSEDGTKYEGYTCRLGVLSEPVCRRATFADTDDVKRQGESQLDFVSRGDDENKDFKVAVNDCLSDDPVYGICSDSIFGPISDWNTSLVTSMDSAFNEKTQFNGNITGWDTSSVRDMSNMFFKAKAFDQDIGNWKKKPHR